MAAEVGQKAPDFTLVSTDLKPVRLADFAGKNLVLAFYRAAFTGVCEKEMCAFRDRMDEFTRSGVEVRGVSVDSPFANKEFAAKHGLSFPLLSDVSRQTIAKYDLSETNVAGIEGLTLAKRSVFVIDRDGVIRYKWVAPEPKVEPSYDEVAAAVSTLS